MEPLNAASGDNAPNAKLGERTVERTGEKAGQKKCDREANLTRLPPA